VSDAVVPNFISSERIEGGLSGTVFYSWMDIEFYCRSSSVRTLNFKLQRETASRIGTCV
jgi:hypothetical protein